jgi:hypothetical protein
MLIQAGNLQVAPLAIIFKKSSVSPFQICFYICTQYELAHALSALGSLLTHSKEHRMFNMELAKMQQFFYRKAKLNSHQGS